MTTTKKTDQGKPIATEKKKRMVKPPMIAATSWLVVKFLPVFENYPGFHDQGEWSEVDLEEITKHVNELFPVLLVRPKNPEVSPGDLVSYSLEKPKIALKYKQAIQWCADFLRETLQNCSVECNDRQQLVDISQSRILGKTSTRCKRLNEAVKLIRKYCPCDYMLIVSGENPWRLSYNVCQAVVVKRPQNEDCSEFLKAIVANHILKAFELDNGENALYYVGMCPRCGKVFEKKRGDQVYDCSLCQKEHTRKK
ncbi:MAG: hypothetical protein WA705_12440 [Candidatus Ozemobacteraceae bacterium]